MQSRLDFSVDFLSQPPKSWDFRHAALMPSDYSHFKLLCFFSALKIYMNLFSMKTGFFFFFCFETVSCILDQP